MWARAKLRKAPGFPFQATAEGRWAFHCNPSRGLIRRCRFSTAPVLHALGTRRRQGYVGDIAQLDFSLNLQNKLLVLTSGGIYYQMRRNASFKVKVSLTLGAEVQVHLPIIIFEEDNATVCYCPAMDLAGYGASEGEAKSSFEVMLGEYLDYTLKKKTFLTDMRRLGWTVKSKKKLIPPTVTQSLERNDNFRRVFDTYNYRKVETSVSLPALV